MALRAAPPMEPSSRARWGEGSRRVGGTACEPAANAVLAFSALELRRRRRAGHARRGPPASRGAGTTGSTCCERRGRMTAPRIWRRLQWTVSRSPHLDRAVRGRSDAGSGAAVGAAAMRLRGRKPRRRRRSPSLQRSGADASVRGRRDRADASSPSSPRHEVGTCEISCDDLRAASTTTRAGRERTSPCRREPTRGVTSVDARLRGRAPVDRDLDRRPRAGATVRALPSHPTSGAARPRSWRWRAASGQRGRLLPGGGTSARAWTSDRGPPGRRWSWATARRADVSDARPRAARR